MANVEELTSRLATSAAHLHDYLDFVEFGIGSPPTANWGLLASDMAKLPSPSPDTLLGQLSIRAKRLGF